jgi:Xaa-Pro aminopeptidase
MEKIKKLKKLLIQFNLDGYIVPKNDEFFSEYVSESKDNLKFISKFTGSSGFALILKKKNYIFVDGRYSLQAKIECGSEFNIITFPKKLPKDILKSKNIKIGFDPKLHTETAISFFFQQTKCKLVAIKKNLIEIIRGNKKDKINNKFYLLKDENVGENFKKKIIKVSNILKKKKINIHFVSAPENIAWLLNIRGRDSKYSPLPNSYLTLDDKQKINFFCDLRKIDKKIKYKLKNINIFDIKTIDKYLGSIKNKKIQIDENSCSILFKNILKVNNTIIKSIDPIYILKSIKNKIEIKNIIKTHIVDGVAVTKFLIWLNKNFNKSKITEIDAEKKLLSFRKKNKTFKFLSFPTISGSGPNGAIIHYKANKKTNRVLRKKDIYLFDSGGQYNFGTTDVTRTISLNNRNQRIKDIFTRVLKGHISVANFKLNKNTTGSNIDIVARKSLNKVSLNYEHGTGHGVGYFLNVHEGPYAISKHNKIKFKEGVVVSNEPGYYEKGKFGIRIENLILVRKKRNNYNFENLTMVPIDKSLIEKKLLTKNEIIWINEYHCKIFKNLKKFMNSSELKELRKYCLNI